MTDTARQDQDMVLLGYVSGVFGIKGWVKIHSWTEPRDAILGYQPWHLGEELLPVRVTDGRNQGKTVVASIDGVDQPEQAQALRGKEIRVRRNQLPKPESGSWYWSDLIGLDVETTGGESLGIVDRMMETGAHDVMVVRGDRERLVPFVAGAVVQRVDLDAKRIVVDWQADYLE